MSVEVADIRRTLAVFLGETFESGSDNGTVYLDRGAGLFDTVAALSAEQASRKVIPGGTTIAAQVNHSLYYLAILERYLKGEAPQANWPESWQLQSVNETDWEMLKRRLEVVYKRVSATLETHDDWDKLEDGFAIAIHTAYHLGAIRQMVKLVGDKDA